MKKAFSLVVGEVTTSWRGFKAAVSRAGPGRLGGALAAFVIVSVVANLLPGRPSTDLAFYEAAAQVIPVLVLALAVESRLFRLPRVDDDPRALATILFLILLGGGEVGALTTLANQATDWFSHFAVIASLALTGLLIIIIAMVDPERMRIGESDEETESSGGKGVAREAPKTATNEGEGKVGNPARQSRNG